MCAFSGAPWRTRTVDTKRRRLVLYPSELMVHLSFNGKQYITDLCKLQAFFVAFLIFFCLFELQAAKKVAIYNKIIEKTLDTPRGLCYNISTSVKGLFLCARFWSAKTPDRTKKSGNAPPIWVARFLSEGGTQTLL